MTIDEAIKIAKDQAEENRNEAYTTSIPWHANDCIRWAEENEQVAHWLEELKDYRDLEEQGLIVKLKIKPNDTVYVLAGNGKITKAKVISIGIEDKETKVYLVMDGCVVGSFNIDNVFLTKKELKKQIDELLKESAL